MVSGFRFREGGESGGCAFQRSHVSSVGAAVVGGTRSRRISAPAEHDLQVKEIVPSRLKPDRGTLRLAVEARNQAGEVVMTATLVVVALRSRGAQPAY